MDSLLHEKIHKIFNPRSIAIIGASSKPGQFSNTSVRRLALWSQKEHVYPINPSLDQLHGLKCYKSIKDLPEKIDLAYICVGSKHVPGIMRDCVEAGVESCLVHTSGFAETGEEGKRLEDETIRIAHEGGIRFMGPNCLGIYNHRSGMLVDRPDSRGSAAVVSHSGALTVLITKLGMERGIHFSKTASCGNQADISAIDLIEYLGEDADTSLIFVYMEGVGDGERFLRVLRQTTKKKPVLIWKGGRSGAGSRAATSHSAALAGDWEVFKAAAQQAGAILCDDLTELIDAGLACECLPLPQGKNVAIATGPGGAGVAAADACDELGLCCPPIGEKSKTALLGFMPAFGSAANPVDLTTVSAADPSLFTKTMDVFMDDPQLHMFLMITSEAQSFVDVLLENRDRWKAKPFAVNMLNLMSSPAECARMSHYLREQGVAVYDTPRQAIKALSHLSWYAQYLMKAESCPNKEQDADGGGVTRAQEIIAQARAQGKTMLTERQAMDLFESYGIPVVGHGLAKSVEEAKEIAVKIGYPLVVKVSSPDVVHKTDAGGVALRIGDEQALERAFIQVTTKPLETIPTARIEGALLERMVDAQFELAMGMTRDAQFGPMVMFGLGGVLIELLRDVTMGAAPLTRQDALDMIGTIRAVKILDGARGMAPVDRERLADILMAISAMATQLPAIMEMDINPLAATKEGLVAVDARIKIKGLE